VLSALAVGAVVVLRCANPTDQEPLKWRSVIEIPVTNEQFVLGEELDGLFENVTSDTSDTSGDLIILYAGDTIYGDTVAIAMPSKDTAEFVVDEDTLDPKIYDDAIGPIEITNAPTVQQSFALPAGTYPGGTSINATQAITINQVYRIVFHDTTVNQLPVTVANNSSADINNLRIGIVGVDTSAGVNVGAGSSGQATLDLATRAIDSVATLVIMGDLPGGSTVNAGEDVAVSFSLNGTFAQSLTVDDHLVSYSKTFTNDYNVSDTVDVDYIDLKYGFFLYSVYNNTGVPLSVRAEHRHLWMTPYCDTAGGGVDSIEDLPTPPDSTAYMGTITSGAVYVPADSTQEFEKLNMSGNRMFCEWQGDSTVTYVDYHISTLQPTGARLTLSAGDSLVFTIKPKYIQFDEMSGTLVKAYEEQSDTQLIEVTFLPGEGTKDSLRGNLILQRVIADIDVKMGLPPRAWLETMYMSFTLYDWAAPGVIVESTMVFNNVRRDSIYSRSIPITNLINNYPDSVAVALSVVVPVGTRMLVTNDEQLADHDDTGLCRLPDQLGAGLAGGRHGEPGSGRRGVRARRVDAAHKEDGRPSRGIQYGNVQLHQFVRASLCPADAGDRRRQPQLSRHDGASHHQ
jgi:hypothetical protein